MELIVSNVFFTLEILVTAILCENSALGQSQSNTIRRLPSRYFKLQSSGSTKYDYTKIDHDVLAGLPRILDASCSNQSQSDTYLKAPELIRKKGYPVEVHEIESEGYILKLHRIPGKVGNTRNPVLIVHGMLQTSRDFLMQCGKKALAYKLADAGFDVWLANLRGNDYSRKHKTLNRNQSAYWDFTVDDLIKYDAPAMIDYILNTTTQPKLTWIGFSLGTAIPMGLLSTQSEYNNKIDKLITMAIIAYVQNSGTTLKFLAKNARTTIENLSTRIHGRLISPKLLEFFRRIVPRICLPEVVFNIPFYCQYFVGMMFRVNYYQANAEFGSILGSGTPSQWPVKVFLQWFQWIEFGRFSYYDFGKDKNLMKYGTEIPPEYNLRNVKVPIFNFLGENDAASSPKDAEKVINELPNVMANIRIPVKRWTHLDFVYGRDADVLVYDKIIQILLQSS